MLLEKIQKENDIKQLKPEELEKLAEEIRQFLVEKISVTGGHKENPTYQEVKAHTTGHAEATLVEFDKRETAQIYS